MYGSSTRREFLKRATATSAASPFMKAALSGNPLTLADAFANLPPNDPSRKFERRERLSYSFENLYNQGEPVLDESGRLALPRKIEIASFLKVHHSDVLSDEEIEQITESLHLGFSLLADIIKNRVYCGLNQVEVGDNYVLSDPNLSATLYILKQINNWVNLFEEPQDTASILNSIRTMFLMAKADTREERFYIGPQGVPVMTSLRSENTLEESFLDGAETKITYEGVRDGGDSNPLFEGDRQLVIEMLNPLGKLVPRTEGLDLVLTEGLPYGNGESPPGKITMGPDAYPLSVLHEWGHQFLDGVNSTRKINAGYSWILEMFRLHVISDVVKQMWDTIYNYINIFGSNPNDLIICLSFFLQIPNSDEPEVMPFDLKKVTHQEIDDIYDSCLICGIEPLFNKLSTDDKVTNREILGAIVGSLGVIKGVREGSIDESVFTVNQRQSITSFLSSLASWCKHLGLGYGFLEPVKRGSYDFNLDNDGRVVSKDIFIDPEICPSYTLYYFAQQIASMRESGREKSSNAIFCTYWFLIMQIFQANYLSLQDIKDPDEFVRTYLDQLEYATQYDTDNRSNYVFETLANVESYDFGFVPPQKVLFAAHIWSIYFTDKEFSKIGEENIYLGRELFDMYALPVTVQMLDSYRDKGSAKLFIKNIADILTETCGLSSLESLEAIQTALRLIIKVFEVSMYETDGNARYLIMSTDPEFLRALTTEEHKRVLTQSELSKLDDIVDWIEELKKGQHTVQSAERIPPDISMAGAHQLTAES